ncbi:hypothetical protein ACWA1C_19580 [Flectobacillus roseus]|jgi:hypothetical protein
MERITTSVSSLLKTIKRPELDYPKMKEKLGEILTQNAQLIETQKLPIKKLAVSMEQTAKQILMLFLRKFEAGEVRNYTVKFTYSYLCKSLGKGFRVPNVKTIIRHIMRFLELPLKFVTQKVRSYIEEIGVNGIALTLHPSVIFFKNDLHQKAHEKGQTIMTSIKGKPLPLPKPQISSYNQGSIPFEVARNPYRRIKEDNTSIKHTASSVGNIMSEMLNQLRMP